MECIIWVWYIRYLKVDFLLIILPMSGNTPNHMEFTCRFFMSEMSRKCKLDTAFTDLLAIFNSETTNMPAPCAPNMLMILLSLILD